MMHLNEPDAGCQLEQAVKVNDWLQAIQTRLFPPTCVLCGRMGAADYDLCHACLADLPYNSPSCQRCALPLPTEGLCGRCLRHPPPYVRSFALFRYAAPVDHLLTGLKFHHRLCLSRLLGDLMANVLASADRPLPELLVPVPLHRTRLRERGYNQALELALPIAKRLDIPLERQRCQRVRATFPQTRLSARDRRLNIKGAFRVAGTIEAHRVAIVDDVVTTGHTVRELARALRRAGAGEVEVWSCARAFLGDA
jgi:ComF family protein